MDALFSAGGDEESRHGVGEPAGLASLECSGKAQNAGSVLNGHTTRHACRIITAAAVTAFIVMLPQPPLPPPLLDASAATVAMILGRGSGVATTMHTKSSNSLPQPLELQTASTVAASAVVPSAVAASVAASAVAASAEPASAEPTTSVTASAVATAEPSSSASASAAAAAEPAAAESPAKPSAKASDAAIPASLSPPPLTLRRCRRCRRSSRLRRLIRRRPYPRAAIFSAVAVVVRAESRVRGVVGVRAAPCLRVFMLRSRHVPALVLVRASASCVRLGLRLCARLSAPVSALALSAL